MSNPDTTTPEATKRIKALVIVYLSALQNGPALPDAEWQAAENLKNELAADIEP